MTTNQNPAPSDTPTAEQINARARARYAAEVETLQTTIADGESRMIRLQAECVDAFETGRPVVELLEVMADVNAANARAVSKIEALTEVSNALNAISIARTAAPITDGARERRGTFDPAFKVEPVPTLEVPFGHRGLISNTRH